MRSSSTDMVAIMHLRSDLILQKIKHDTEYQVLSTVLQGTNHFWVPTWLAVEVQSKGPPLIIKPTFITSENSAVR